MTQPPIMQSAVGAEVVIDGRKVLYFAGTAYLAMQGHPEVIRAGCEAMQKYGVGAATTRAGFGHHPPTLDVEAAAARYFGQPAAFYYPSGYSGPTVLLAALNGAYDAVFVDDQVHYAIADAVRAAGKPCVRFAHRDATDLKKNLRAQLRASHRPLLFSDGVFAASGRIAPVAEYVDALRNIPGALLCLDDAHGVGVLGESGRGTFDHFNISAERVNNPRAPATGAGLFFCATLSKALGGYGGIVAGETAWIEKAKGASHVYDGSSAPPPAIAAASAKALSILTDDATPRQRVAANSRLLLAGLLRIGLDIDESPTPVISLDLGEGSLMAGVQKQLMDRGIAIGYLTYAGTEDRGLLRIAVSAAHTPEMIDRLVAELREAL